MNVSHEIGQGALRVVQHLNGGIDDLPHVVGRDIGGHTHGNAAGSVHQQVGEPGGEHLGLPPGLVKVGRPIHGLFFNIPKHLIGQPGHAGLGIPVGSRGIAVHRAEIAVSLHQGIAHGEVLGQAHQGVIDRAVSVGVVFAQYIAYTGGRLFKRFIVCQAALIHGVQDTAVYRLQAVPHVGQGPADDDGHGVLNIRFLHLRNQGRDLNFLIWVPDFLRIVLGFFAHRFRFLLARGAFLF